ncbi:hypothetical protein [Microbacterium sp. Ru50]|uniref:hypothetical protein n=1 Tax=Microbacterium sp. Ru50 TaxID=2080744 RepID=UPI0011AF26FE|nr:hypothetical protein [Microbacterium sp. Ru50]
MPALFITRFINQHSVDGWEEAFSEMPANRFEALAFQTFIEGFRGLIRSRDAVDDVRNAYVWSRRDDPGVAVSNAQQMELFRATEAFFNDLYSAVSKLSGVVARNSAVFQTNFSDNGPFLRWLDDRYPQEHGRTAEVEKARLFRAILAHPQQFPPYDWATFVDRKKLTLVVLWGARGRGRNPIPKGATVSHALAQGDWQFQAPDEASVTNAVGALAEEILLEMLLAYSKRRALRRPLTSHEARVALAPEVDVSDDQRRVNSRREGI